jgi:RNA polymerase sigma factor (sigma-70 family)
MYDGFSFTDLYNQNRNKFMHWAKSWTGLKEAEVVDVYQDACIILWQKIQAGNLVLTAKPATFLFGIGRNVLRERLRGQKREPLPLPDGMNITDDDLNDFMDSPEEEMIRLQRNSCLEKIIQTLGEGCASIVRLTFFHDKNSKEIAEISGYASGDVVRQMRRRCLTQLRELYEKHCN